ncbi:MAG: sigma factor [Rhodoplanes sp.]
MITARKIMPKNTEGAAATVKWGRLIEAVATRRDRAAFIMLFEHFAPRVKTFALRSGASEATAEELARDTLLMVWLKADSFVPSSAGAAWIFAIARNLRIDALRRMQRDSGQALGIERRPPSNLISMGGQRRYPRSRRSSWNNACETRWRSCRTSICAWSNRSFSRTAKARSRQLPGRP